MINNYPGQHIRKLNCFLWHTIYQTKLITLIMATITSEKFLSGKAARQRWSKPTDSPTLTVSQFNEMCNNVFVKYADLVLDDRVKPQTAVKAVPVDTNVWQEENEIIYLFVQGDDIMKIGGTRNSMGQRWGSYLCGFHVPERNRSGKCSVTNAHLYHTIEKNLLEGKEWSVWCWKLPRVEHTVEIMGETVTIVTQTYHAYESVCIRRFKDRVGSIPVLCMNSDPAYKTKEAPKHAAAETVVQNNSSNTDPLDGMMDSLKL